MDNSNTAPPEKMHIKKNIKFTIIQNISRIKPNLCDIVKGWLKCVWEVIRRLDQRARAGLHPDNFRQEQVQVLGVQQRHTTVLRFRLKAGHEDRLPSRLTQPLGNASGAGLGTEVCCSMNSVNCCSKDTVKCSSLQ